MENTIFVSTDVENTERLVRKAVSHSITAECVDSYRVSSRDGDCLVLVFEKYYLRSSRASLTVVIDDCTGKTRAHVAASGGAQGLIRIDWGAGRNFSSAVLRELWPYKIG